MAFDSGSDLLLHDGLYIEYKNKLPKEISSTDFITWCMNHYKKMSPLYKWLLDLKLSHIASLD